VIRRRDFITLLGGAATWPFAANAQQSGMPVIGLLHIATPFVYSLTGFRQGLKEAGYVEGQNVAIEYRWANNEVERLPELAADLVRRRVDVIVALASGPAAVAAKAATTTIPIVFGNGADPIQLGLVASMNRPGGNISGLTSLSGELGGKHISLLHELLPQAARFAVLVKTDNVTREALIRDTQAAATAIGRQVEVFTANTNSEIDTAIASLVQKRAEALLVTNDPLFTARRVQLVTLTARHAVPAIYPFREYAEAGGLMSYGANLSDRDRQVGVYTGNILKGAKPANLPVMQSNKFEFLINLQTAKLLGIEVPPGLLAIADEVIE
jgi:putative tryptophan/tyrosine transport system substrate-binding protein